jgi:mono/diheme cytochrome c family protein
MIKNLSIPFAFLVLISCGSPSVKEGTFIPEDLSRRDEIRFKQYIVNGQRSYTVHCANCHGKEGEGIGKLFPPVAKSDYLMNNLDKLSCIIKYGQKGEIVVNGISYNMEMPAQAQLSPIEIAEISTFIANSWGNEGGFISVNDVRKNLENCDATVEE